MKIRVLSALMALLLLSGSLISCKSEKPDGESTTASTETTTAVTEEEKVDVGQALAENKYANAGLELLLKTMKTYYVKRTHTLKSDIHNSAQAYVWPTTATLEALAEGYRLYPENGEIKDYYVDMLDNCLEKFVVKKATITNKASGKRYTGMTYYNSSAGNTGDYYYDDNAWVCVQLFNAYSMLGDEKYLDRAKELLEFFWTGWDDVYGGGIYWDKTYSGRKGICTNGPVTISYLLGYKFTGNQDYLDKALQIYNWVETSGIKNDSNCYHAGIGTDRDNWVAAYDQGTMITASTLLYEITGDEQYLTNAKKTTTGATGLLFEVSGRGDKATVKMKGNPIFKSWCIGWALRGVLTYYTDKTSKGTSFMDYFEKVMDATMEASTDGWYDPYFLSGDWKDQSTTDVMQPAGTATCLFLSATFDIYGMINREFSIK